MCRAPRWALPSTWSFLFNLQGLGSVKLRVGLSLQNELMDGHMDGCKHHLLRRSLESSSPEAHHSVTIAFLPTPPRRGREAIVSGALEAPTPLDKLLRPPTSGCHPFPRCPHFLGSLSLGPFTSGYPSLSGVPVPDPHDTRTGSRALTGPATGRSAGQSAAGASSGSTRRTDPHSLPGRPGPSRRK